VTSESKRGLVEKLVELTVRDPVGNIFGNPSDLDIEMHDKLRMRFHEQQIEIRLKHFTTEQLEALLEFHESNMGKSILEAQNRISEEFSSSIELVSASRVPLQDFIFN